MASKEIGMLISLENRKSGGFNSEARGRWAFGGTAHSGGLQCMDEAMGLQMKD